MLPTAQRYGMGVLTSSPLNGGWLSGRADPTAASRATMGAAMFDPSVPANRLKLEAVEQLSKLAAETGLPLPHLALGFAKAHPAVTSVIIGPRRPEQLADLLAAGDVSLGEDVLDRIDEIVPAGTNLNPGDIFDATPSLLDKRLRRR